VLWKKSTTRSRIRSWLSPAHEPAPLVDRFHIHTGRPVAEVLKELASTHFRGVERLGVFRGARHATNRLDCKGQLVAYPPGISTRRNCATPVKRVVMWSPSRLISAPCVFVRRAE
jgi:hypothetical protein